MFITCIWTALSVDLTSVRLSRVFQGFGIAPAQWYVLKPLLECCPAPQQPCDAVLSRGLSSTYTCKCLYCHATDPGFNLRYFHHSVHERGFRSIMWNFFALGGATLWGVEYPCIGLRANRARAEVRSHTATSSRTCRGSLGFGSPASPTDWPSSAYSSLCPRSVWSF